MNKPAPYTSDSFIKMRRSLPILFFTWMAVIPIQAQTNTDNGGVNMPPPPGAGQNMPPRDGPMSKLTKEEREQLKAAHDKAIQQDPSLDQKMKSAHEAMEAARQAMHDAMIKADPTVASILEKITPRKWERKLERESGSTPPGSGQSSQNAGNTTISAFATNSAPLESFKHEGHRMPPGFANLTPSEQARLKSVHEQVKNDPSVIAAKEAEKKATTPEERRSAKDAVHKAMRDAMIKADPSVAPILMKIQPPPRHDEPSAEGQGAQMAPQ